MHKRPLEDCELYFSPQVKTKPYNRINKQHKTESKDYLLNQDKALEKKLNHTKRLDVEFNNTKWELLVSYQLLPNFLNLLPCRITATMSVLCWLSGCIHVVSL